MKAAIRNQMHLRMALGAAALMTLVLSMPSAAHHAHGQYDKAMMDIEGVVTEFHLLNPHAWVYMEVTDENGETRLWSIEASSAGQLRGMGVTPDYIKPGDRIKARCHPLRDGSPGCLVGFVKAADGTIKDWDGQESVPPAGF